MMKLSRSLEDRSWLLIEKHCVLDQIKVLNEKANDQNKSQGLTAKFSQVRISQTDFQVQIDQFRVLHSMLPDRYIDEADTQSQID